MSDKRLLKAKPLKTLELLATKAGMEDDERDLCRKIKDTIRSNHCQGLIIGYPLNEENEEPFMTHSEYIENFLEILCREEKISIPVTLVGEDNTLMQVK